MKEAVLRKWHRTGGIVLALFVLVQVLTGLVLTVEDLIGEYWGGIIHSLHYDFGTAGGIYRILLGLGLVWMVTSGSIIYGRIRARRSRKSRT